MILIDNVKYSCLECIRGHRSTLCRHHMRPLLQVRSKGRPNLLFPYGNKNYRIAVFAQEVEDDEKPQAQNCKNTPVVILKASNKHVIDVTNGQILGRYDDLDKDKMHTPVIGPDNFVVSSSCCSAGVSKVRKGCSCDQKKVLPLKIFRSYISKKMALPEAIARRPSPSSSSSLASMASDTPRTSAPLPHSSVSGAKAPKIVPEALPAQPLCDSGHFEANMQQLTKPQTDPKTIPILHHSSQASGYSLAQQLESIHDFATTSPGDTPGKLQSQSFVTPQGYTFQAHAQSNNGNAASDEQNVFQVVNVSSCSIPGTCQCSSNCSCSSCMVHNPPPKNDDPLVFLNNDTQYGSNLLLKLESPINTAETYVRELPKDLGQYSTYLAQLSGYETNPPPFLSELQMELQTALRENAQSLADQGLQPDSSPCSCPDNECYCRNCEKHGIIDGYKLDDIFGNQAGTNIHFHHG